MREVGEEVGSRLIRRRCNSSKPTLAVSVPIMLGFHASRERTGQFPGPDGEEIAEPDGSVEPTCFWLCSSGEVKIPPKISIARHLIEAWYGEELPGDWSR